jgi:hypothetical protein
LHCIEAWADIKASAKAANMALARSWSPSAPSRYLLSHAAASIVVGTFTVILLKWFVWKLLLEVDAVTVASGGCPSAQRVVHHWLGLNSPPRTTKHSAN